MKSMLSIFQLSLLTGCGLFWPVSLMAQDDKPRESPPWMQQNGRQGGIRQGHRPPMGGGIAITVEDGSVFVVTDGQLLKYDQKTLQLQASAALTSKQKPQDTPSGDETGGRSSQGSSQGNPPSPRQGGPMMGGGGGTALSIKEGFVYLVTNGKLMKFDARSLDLEGSVELQKKGPLSSQIKKKKSSKENDFSE